MKSSTGISLPRGDNLFVKRPNDPKTLPKGPKRNKWTKFDGNYTKDKLKVRKGPNGSKYG